MTAVNLRGVLLMTQYAVPIMIANGGGSFVNVSSISSVNVQSHTSFMYAAAKAGVNALTKSVAVEYGRQGIRANVIAPGFTFTEFMGEETPFYERWARRRRSGGRDAAGAGRSRSVPRLGSRLLRHRRDPSGRRWLVGEARLNAGGPIPKGVGVM